MWQARAVLKGASEVWIRLYRERALVVLEEYGKKGLKAVNTYHYVVAAPTEGGSNLDFRCGWGGNARTTVSG